MLNPGAAFTKGHILPNLSITDIMDFTAVERDSATAMIWQIVTPLFLLSNVN